MVIYALEDYLMARFSFSTHVCYDFTFAFVLCVRGYIIISGPFWIGS